MQINLCDVNHQPVAFQGVSCPVCRAKFRPQPEEARAPLYRADLDAALRAHYVGRLQRIVDGHQAVLTEEDKDRLCGWQDPWRL